MIKRGLSFAGIIIGLIGGISFAGTEGLKSALSVDRIVEKANHASYYQGRDGRAQVLMSIKDSQGRERKRQFTILRLNVVPAEGSAGARCGEQKFYVYFHRPSDVNKTVFMVWKHLNRDDDRWLYLPALDLVKRIAATDKRTSFVGSHFFYEDVSGRGTREDDHELVETTKNYYVLKNTPKRPKTVEFSSYKVWVHRKTFLPVRTVYYDRNGRKYRLYEALKVETIDGYPTVVKARMKNLLNGGETILSYRRVKYNINVPESLFTERFLRNPPKKYLR